MSRNESNYSLADWAVWSVVEQLAEEIGIERFGTRDRRRKLNTRQDLKFSNWIALPGDVAGVSNTASKLNTLPPSTRC